MPDVSAIGAVVPQLFYDIISRLVPGTVLILSFCVIYPEPAYMLSTIEPSGWNSVGCWMLFLMVAYVAAILLFGLWYGVTAIFPGIGEREDEGVDVGKDKPIPRSVMHDTIRIKEPIAGARLVKLRAEHHLSQVLIIGWIVLAAANICFCFLEGYFSRERVIIECILILNIVGTCLFMRYIAMRYIINLKAHWYILGCDTDC